jgi:hypothetical protein
MAWQIAKPLSLGEVQEIHFLAGIPKGTQLLGQAETPPCTRKESNTGFHPVPLQGVNDSLTAFQPKARGNFSPAFGMEK